MRATPRRRIPVHPAGGMGRVVERPQTEEVR